MAGGRVKAVEKAGEVCSISQKMLCSGSELLKWKANVPFKSVHWDCRAQIMDSKRDT